MANGGLSHGESTEILTSQSPTPSTDKSSSSLSRISDILSLTSSYPSSSMTGENQGGSPSRETGIKVGIIGGVIVGALAMTGALVFFSRRCYRTNQNAATRVRPRRLSAGPSASRFSDWS